MTAPDLRGAVACPNCGGLNIGPLAYRRRGACYDCGDVWNGRPSSALASVAAVDLQSLMSYALADLRRNIAAIRAGEYSGGAPCDCDDWADERLAGELTRLLMVASRIADVLEGADVDSHDVGEYCECPTCAGTDR